MRRFNGVRYARRIAVLALILGAAGTFVARAAHAVEGDVRGTVMTEQNAVGIGGGVLAPLGTSERWYFNPNLEVGFASNAKLISMNGDVHYDMQKNQEMSVWMGAGPAVLVNDRDFGSSTTDLGLNVFTGIAGTGGSVRPFAQLKGVVADNKQIVLQGGIRF